MQTKYMSATEAHIERMRQGAYQRGNNAGHYDRSLLINGEKIPEGPTEDLGELRFAYREGYMSGLLGKN